MDSSVEEKFYFCQSDGSLAYYSLDVNNEILTASSVVITSPDAQESTNENVQLHGGTIPKWLDNMQRAGWRQLPSYEVYFTLTVVLAWRLLPPKI